MKLERIEELIAALGITRALAPTSWHQHVSRLPTADEYFALLESARALARLEEWLRGATIDRTLELVFDSGRKFEATLFIGGQHGTTETLAGQSERVLFLPAAINAALDAAGKA